MMIFKNKIFLERLALLTSFFIASSAFCQDAAQGENSGELDPALKEKVAYVEELVKYGFPDFAEIVIAETKKKWPESESLFFAIEIRGMLLLGKSEEAEKKIAALNDRKSSKYWAARLEVAMDHFSRGRNDECLKIYDDFFANMGQKPPKELTELVRTAYWQRAQIQIMMKRYKEAAADLQSLMARVNKNASSENANIWCNAACDAADLYLRVAADAAPKNRTADLNAAKKIISQLLWERNNYIYFGRAIAMKAHLELLSGRLDRAQSVIDDFMGDLTQIHEALEKADPNGREGFLKQSPMPQCRYLMADMLWKEALKESPNAATDKGKARIGDLLFGEKGKNGRRNGAGAYNHAVNVYIRYPYSPWASAAEKTVGEIEKFVQEKFGMAIKTQITPEQRAKVREMRFRSADEKFGSGEFETAIADYFDALSAYPEERESVPALLNIVDGYFSLMKRSSDESRKNEWRLKADVVSKYVAERFAGNPDDSIMNAAGNVLIAIANKEKQQNEIARADALFLAFITNYKRHINAPTLAAQLGGAAYQEATKLDDALAAAKYREALKYYLVMDEYYTNSTFYATALSTISICYQKLGDKTKSIEYLRKYIDNEKKPLLKMQSQMRMATIFQNEGLELLKTASTNATAEAVAAQENKAVASILRGIMEFKRFSKQAAEKLEDTTISKDEKEKYQKLYETSQFFSGYCWSRLIEPSRRLEVFRQKNIDPKKNAIDTLESYTSKYPNTDPFSKQSYLQLSAIYTMANDVENTKNALDRLNKYFKDSPEARTAWPRLAKSLVEFASTVTEPERKQSILREASRIYADMIRSENSNYHAYDFVLAGESLIEAEDWKLAQDAFDMAIMKAGTNFTTVIARATIGKTTVLKEKGEYLTALDDIQNFFSNKKLSGMPIATNACMLAIDIGLKQGKIENDTQIRDRYYAAANDGISRLRGYWAKEPQWKRDTVEMMSADALLAQAACEESKGDAKKAASLRGKVAVALYSLINARKPVEALPEPAEGEDQSLKRGKTLEQFTPEELAILEEAYSKIIPTLLTQGAKQASRAIQFGEEYLKYFPNGSNIDLVRRSIDEAKVLSGKTVSEPAASAGSVDESK